MSIDCIRYRILFRNINQIKSHVLQRQIATFREKSFVKLKVISTEYKSDLPVNWNTRDHSTWSVSAVRKGDIVLKINLHLTFKFISLCKTAGVMRCNDVYSECTVISLLQQGWIKSRLKICDVLYFWFILFPMLYPSTQSLVNF